MPAPCGSKPCPMRGIRTTRYPAPIRSSGISRCTSERAVRGADQQRAIRRRVFSLRPRVKANPPDLCGTAPGSFAPGRNDGRSLHDGPLVLVGGDHREAVGLAAFPGGAVAVFV